MKRKVTLIVLDSFGIGALPDAERFSDTGADTFGGIYRSCGLSLPNLASIGLFNIDGISITPRIAPNCGAYGRANEKSNGKDTVTGHWEMMGIISSEGFRIYSDGFPNELIAELTNACGRSFIGNCVASGTEIIARLGTEHVKTGAPIVYTSADSVFQIAAHEDVVPNEELYDICKKARVILDNGHYGVCRVIARPFTGDETVGYRRTENRRDYAVVPPKKTYLDELTENGYKTCAIGKIEDIFSNRGITFADHTKNNADGIAATIRHMQNEDYDFVFTNLVDFDSLYGHRNNPEGYRDALEYFDRHLPQIMDCMKKDDLLIITADHGCDPTTPGTDHTREYVPVLIYSERISTPWNIGTLDSFSVIGTIAKKYITNKGIGLIELMRDLIDN